MPEKILVIDDERGIREGCQRALTPEGFQIATAASLREGGELVRSGGYDMVLLDVMLPDGRGLDLLPTIREIDPEIVVVIITGFATVEMAVEAIKQGAYNFISKPFSVDQLLMTVHQGLERRRLMLEAKRLQDIEREAETLAQEKEQMEQLNQFKTEFTTMVAHELRAPITALQSFLLSILKGYVPPEEQKMILQRAIDRSQELLDLVNDLLNLAAMREVTIEQEREILPLHDTLDRILPLFQSQIEGKALKLEVDIQGNPVVEADPDQMTQLWTNLISNAIKYTPEAGKVTVKLGEVDGWVIGSVCDTGIGIASEDLPKIFEEFYRTTQAKKFARTGTGLGLTLVKQILEGHGGTIEVDSQLGEGSCFTFRLPATKNQPPAKS